MGAGFTLVISPLLALMRNQIEMAEQLGIRARTINSSNQEEWDSVVTALREDRCDILLISPERLSNEYFRKSVLPNVAGRIGLFVVDEAHCISDWGHDFRPDYRRIARILEMLPRNIPLLATTATANNRVVEDICEQLGRDLLVLRGSLDRPSLCLQVIRLADQSERLAWLAENLPKLPGSGIVYCLTVQDVERVTTWLKRKGFSAEAYHAGICDHERTALEKAFLSNRVKILVATVALGMGFDKPDVGYVIHFQRPGSVVAYYQQVGRAGRGLERAYGILLSGAEDDDIQDYFIESAFPTVEDFDQILEVLKPGERLSPEEILARTNVSRSTLEKALKLLELDEIIKSTSDGYRVYARTSVPWRPDIERIERVTQQRRLEKAQMQAYAVHQGCLMEFLLRALDEPEPGPCGRCSNCRGEWLPCTVRYELALEAKDFLMESCIEIQPRKDFPAGILGDRKSSIPTGKRIEIGRCLCYYGEPGWGTLVRVGKYQYGYFSDELVEAAARLILERWNPKPFPAWVTAVPSQRHPKLVPDFASRLAKRLGLCYVPVLKRVSNAPPQKTMQNSARQAQNVLSTLTVEGDVPSKPVLLVDDIVDSRWTLTIAGYLLRERGAGPVYPFALAMATPRNA